MLILILASGPDKGTVQELFDHRTVVLGREGDLLNLKDYKASRKHCKLWSEDGNWFVEDLGSRHGTYCNNKRIETKTKLKDGDQIQIGRTVLVVARIKTEQAERFALLGDPPLEAQYVEPQTGSSHRKTALIVGSAVAACIVVGLNIVQWWAWEKRAESQNQRFAYLEKQNQNTTRQILDSIQARDNRPDPTLPMLHEIEDKLTSTEQQQERLLDIFQIPKAPRNHTSLNQDPSYRIDFQPTVEPREQTDSELDNNPDAKHLANLASAITRISKDLDAASTRTDKDLQKLIKQVRRELKKEIDKQSDETADLLQQLLVKVEQLENKHPDIAQVMAVLSIQAQETEKLIQNLREEVKQSPSSTVELEKLGATMAQRMYETHGLIANLINEVKNTPNSDQNLKALNTALISQSKSTEKMLQELRTLIDEQLAKALVDSTLPTKPNPIIVKLETLQDDIHKSAQWNQEQRDTLEAKLAENQIHLETMRERTDALLTTLDGALKKADSNSNTLADKTIQQGLGNLKSWFAGQIETLHNEIQEANSQRGLAVKRRTQRPANTDHVVGSHRLSASSPPGDSKLEPPLHKLTGVQLRYKLAWETNQPVPKAKGSFNPLTAEVKDSVRELDPAAAKALGIQSWWHWYKLDLLAEEERLEQQAQRYRDQQQSLLNFIPSPTAMAVGTQAEATEPARWQCRRCSADLRPTVQSNLNTCPVCGEFIPKKTAAGDP